MLNFLRALLNRPLAAAALAAMLFCCGCVSEEECLRITPEKWTSELVIGAALPLSGPDAGSGQSMLRGAELAVELLNSQRGIAGKRVKLITADTFPDPAQAVYRLAEQNALAVVGGFLTQEAERLAQAANAIRMPLVIPIASGDGLTVGRPLVKAISCTNRQQCEGLAAYLWYWRQLKKLAILIPAEPEMEFERDVARLTARAFADLGGEIIATAEYRRNDYDRAMRSLLRCGPAAIMVPGIGKEAAEMIRALRQLGYSGVICGADGWDHIEFVPTLGKYFEPGECVFAASFSKEYPEEEYLAFSEKFRQTYHYLPSSEETITADAVMMLAAVLPGAKTIVEYNRNWSLLQPYFGAASQYSVKPNGGIDRMVFINYLLRPNTRSEYPEIGLIRYFPHSRLATYLYD